MRVELDLALTDERERSLKSSRSAASSVSNAKRDIGRKADEILRLIEIKYGDF